MVSTASKRKVQYSPAELKLLTLIKQSSGPVSSEELAKQHYGKYAPYHARKAVVSFMDSLIKKAKANREPFKIVKSPRNGPHPIEYSLEAKG